MYFRSINQSKTLFNFEFVDSIIANISDVSDAHGWLLDCIEKIKIQSKEQNNRKQSIVYILRPIIDRLPEAKQQVICIFHYLLLWVQRLNLGTDYSRSGYGNIINTLLVVFKSQKKLESWTVKLQQKSSDRWLMIW